MVSVERERDCVRAHARSRRVCSRSASRLKKGIYKRRNTTRRERQEARREDERRGGAVLVVDRLGQRLVPLLAKVVADDRRRRERQVPARVREPPADPVLARALGRIRDGLGEDPRDKGRRPDQQRRLRLLSGWVKF